MNGDKKMDKIQNIINQILGRTKRCKICGSLCETPTKHGCEECITEDENYLELT